MSFICRSSSDSFPFSLRIKAKVLTMARKVLYYQNFCYLSVFLTSFAHAVPITLASLLFFEHARSVFLHLHVLSRYLDYFSSGDSHDTSPPLSLLSTFCSFYLPRLLLLTHYFLTFLETIFLASVPCILLELFVSVLPFILISFMGCSSSVCPLTARYPFLILCNSCLLIVT